MLYKARQLLRQPIKHSTTPNNTHILDGHTLTLEKLSQLSNQHSRIKLTQEAWNKLNASRFVVDTLANTDKPYYGINTGVGSFSNVKISAEDLKEYQLNLIRSHATGIGELLSLEASRRVHALRINTLAKGYSGISTNTLQRLIDLYNSGCIPSIPSCGTVGSSGDLVPLSHIALNLIGEGELWNPLTQQYEPADKVLKQHLLEIPELQAKDGLSLMNGNMFIVGVGSIALEQAITIIKSIQPISALTFLSLKGQPRAFDVSIHRMRMHAGQSAVAEIMREMLPDTSSADEYSLRQDPYSLKCIPQVHGPTLENIIQAKDCLEIEMNSGSDNPLVFTEQPFIVSGGNFHGEYPAKQLDTLGIYVHEVGSLSSQRIKRLTNPTKNLGLPAFLSAQGGLCSGMMTWENVAASLVSENKVLVYPASADSAETCADKEDHVSMGSFSARKAILISQNVSQILAVELFAACQGLQFRFIQDKDFTIPHKGLQKIYNHVKNISPLLETDRYTVPEYQELLSFINSGELWDMLLTEIDQKYIEDIQQENIISQNQDIAKGKKLAYN